MGYIFESSIRKNDLSNLNRLLINKDINISDKETAFNIAVFLIDKDEYYLDSFINFCLDNRQIINNELFSMLLTKIKNLFDNDEELLSDKIYTISVVGLNDNKLSNEEYFSLLTRILFSNIEENKLYFLRGLFKNKILKENIIKRNIICELILSNKINVQDCSNIFDVMTNEDVLKLDDDNYSKLFISVINGNDKLNYLFIELFNNKELTLSKKINAVSYLDKVKEYLDKYSYDRLKLVLKSNEINLFNIVYCDRLLNLNDRDYEITINNLSNSNKPLSYVKVLGCSNISKEQREYALTLINQGEVNVDKYLKNNFKTDYKDDVAEAAISPVLLNAPIDLYKNILSMINEWCNYLGEIYSTSKIDSRIDFGTISTCTVGLLKIPELYDNNYDRLIYTINKLISVKSNKKLVNDIFLFASNPISKCYIDIEYELIIKLIILYYEKGMSSIIKDLFINANVLYMDFNDRSILFNIAKSMDKDKILELRDELEKKGNYSFNTSYIFNGVDENTYKLIMPNIKKLCKDKL